MATENVADVDGCVIGVALFCIGLERPDAPLALVGPFDDVAAATAYTDGYAGRLKAGYYLRRVRLPTAAALDAHIRDARMLRDDDPEARPPLVTQCLIEPDGVEWNCCLDRGHDGPHGRYEPSYVAKHDLEQEYAPAEVEGDHA
jgi:hypothetical protein